MRESTLRQAYEPVRQNDPFTELSHAIVLRAVSDYRRALLHLQKKPDSNASIALKRDCERFFRSGLFGMPTSLDGTYLIRKLKEEIHYDG